MRMPESRRAIGTDGFRISSLRSCRKLKKVFPIDRETKQTEYSGDVSNQILMILSLSSFLRFNLACRVAAILDARATDQIVQRRRREECKEREISPYLPERSLLGEELVRVEHLAPRSPQIRDANDEEGEESFIVRSAELRE